MKEEQEIIDRYQRLLRAWKGKEETEYFLGVLDALEWVLDERQREGYRSTIPCSFDKICSPLMRG